MLCVLDKHQMNFKRNVSSLKQVRDDVMTPTGYIPWREVQGGSAVALGGVVQADVSYPAGPQWSSARLSVALAASGMDQNVAESAKCSKDKKYFTNVASVKQVQGVSKKVAP